MDIASRIEKTGVWVDWCDGDLIIAEKENSKYHVYFKDENDEFLSWGHNYYNEIKDAIAYLKSQIHDLRILCNKPIKYNF